jgi:hypothetical protein
MSAVSNRHYYMGTLYWDNSSSSNAYNYQYWNTVYSAHPATTGKTLAVDGTTSIHILSWSITNISDEAYRISFGGGNSIPNAHHDTELPPWSTYHVCGRDARVCITNTSSSPNIYFSARSNNTYQFTAGGKITSTVFYMIEENLDVN